MRPRGAAAALLLVLPASQGLAAPKPRARELGLDRLLAAMRKYGRLP